MVPFGEKSQDQDASKEPSSFPRAHHDDQVNVRAVRIYKVTEVSKVDKRKPGHT